jgi:FAD synthetase
MNKIIEIDEAIKIASKLRKQSKTIVVAGGFFDVLHLGHIKFLEKAKKEGNYLFVLLEDDAKAKKSKGKARPVNSQKDRAEILSSIQSVDYVIMLKNMTNNNLYDKILLQIRPNVIATTYGDPYVERKKTQAKLVQGKVVCVIRRISDLSTTKYIESININK